MNKRIYYLDNLRVIAIFAIMLVHTALLWSKPEIMGINISKFFIGIGRIGVPLFLMISGALLLNRNYPSIKDFYKKRFPRILIPFVFWILLYIIIHMILYPPESVIYSFIHLFVHNRGWYVYLIIGVYLALPFINDFIRCRELNEVKYFVILFILASIFYTFCVYFDVNTSLDLRFFIGGVSYLVLGYYLANVEVKSPNKVLILSILVFLVCLIIKYNFPHIGSILYKSSALNLNSHLHVSIFQIGLSASVFMFFRCLEFDNISSLFKKFNRFLSLPNIRNYILSFSKASYGMYLSCIVLMIFLRYYCMGLPGSGTMVVLMLLGINIAVFLVTWIIVLIMNKLPLLKKFSGYH